MRSSRVTKRRALIANSIDSWPKVNPDALALNTDEAEIQAFRRREMAIRMYADNGSLKEIFDSTGIPKQELYRLSDRCLLADVDGRVAGFRGLLFYRHLNESPNRSKVITTGSAELRCLRDVFRRYPSIQEALHMLAIEGKRKGHKLQERVVPIKTLHEEFLKLCDKAKIKFPNYPFNFDSAGLPALRRWVKAERVKHALRYWSANDPKAAKEATARGRDESGAIGVSRVFQQVQCDGHKIDARLKIELPSPTGEGTIYREISRIWIIAIIEVMSRAVLGYCLALGTNYRASDVMKAIRNTLRPWKRRQLTVTTIDYQDGEGMPNGCIDELSFACFDEIRIDNAKAHLSVACLNYIEKTVGAVPILIPTGTPNANPYVEGFFKLLEEAGIHRSTGTTGSNKDDPRAQPTTEDLRYFLSYELLADMVDLLVARINGMPAPHSSVSRLEALKTVVMRRQAIIRRIPASLREEAIKYDMWEDANIGRAHRRPVVRWQGVDYANDAISSAYSLIGKAVLLLVDSDDLRTVECFLEDGTPLGTLYAEPRWRRTRHSLATRKQANKLEDLFRHAPDVPVAFRLHLQKEASRSKQKATQLKRVLLEQGLEEADAAEFSNAILALQSSEEREVREPEYQDDESDFAEAESLLANITTIYRKS